MDSNSKILIADENPTERARLREGLSRAGWHFVDEASNGEEALIKLTRGQFDAALIDMMLTRHADRTGAVNHGKTGSDSPISRATTRQLSAAPAQFFYEILHLSYVFSYV